MRGERNQKDKKSKRRKISIFLCQSLIQCTFLVFIYPLFARTISTVR
jgi:hypothetical protein